MTEKAAMPSERAMEMARAFIYPYLDILYSANPNMPIKPDSHAGKLAALLDQFAAEARLALADEIAKPYPEDIFTPFTDNELGKLHLIWAQAQQIVPNFSDRCMANWARRIAKNVRERARLSSPEHSKGAK